MKINKVYLENIRSYEKEELEIPSGAVLLSGNIGSGKSSILLAIEFALFGLQRGILSGNSLLRTGADKGKINLELEIEGKKVEIERTLKRGKKSTIQDSGFISIDGVKEELSASELKERVLKLLNYPPEYLRKSGFLYRYTVYTPQEEMREILQESSEERIDTLRKIFGIDKYKRILENLNLFSNFLRQNIQNKKGISEGLEEKKKNLRNRKIIEKEIKKEIEKLIPQLKEINKNSEEKKEILKKIEKKISEFTKIKLGIDSKKSELNIIKEAMKDASEESENLGKDSKDLKIKTEKTNIKNIDKLLENIKNKELEQIKIEREDSILENRKKECENLIKEIDNLEICPKCKQKVTEKHKENFVKDMENEIKSIDEKLKNMENKKKNLMEELKKLKENKENIDKSKNEIEILKNKQKHKEKIDNKLKKFNLRKSELMNEIKILIERLKEYEDIDKKFDKIKEDIEDISKKEKEKEIKKAELNQRLKSNKEIIKETEKEIKIKKKALNSASYLSDLRNWLGNDFSKILETIEKAVMAKLHYDFSQLFKKWFSMLVSDLNAVIDESFTPRIEQQGYELEYDFLSGGERTAAALSYRLALNQVINSLVSKINTRDLLILDEPTDGFSSEQLDKMRDVLNDLKTEQLIIVSHEPKIETFVEHIIRFEKEGNTTQIS